MDAIGNYNGSAGSQLLPEAYQFQLPEFSQGVVRDGNRGDFIGVVGRRVDQPLYDLVRIRGRNKAVYNAGVNYGQCWAEKM